MPGEPAPKASAIQAKRLLKPTLIRAIRGSPDLEEISFFLKRSGFFL
jgi:hypothetical protein